MINRRDPDTSFPQRIPFNRAALLGDELHYVQEAVANGHIMGDGPFSKKCEALLEAELGVSKAFLTTSCTDALEMAAMLLDVQPGDEVILPSFAFVSTANAFAVRGARPVFAEIRPDTLNLDETLLEGLITPRTKAIVVLHYGGIGCEMDPILALAERHGVAVVEDNAHGLYGKYRGQWLGTLGALATQSFHETKNFTCGEGGALLINDARFIARAEVLRQNGTNRARFSRGEVDAYTWVDTGSSFLPSDITAAFLYAQLEKRHQVQQQRRAIWAHYHERLTGWAAANRVTVPTVPPDCEQAYHMFYLLLPAAAARGQLIAFLKDRGILAVSHYLPLHLSEMGRRYGGKTGDCSVTEDISARLVRLPFYTVLSREDQAYVVDCIEAFSFD